MAFAHVGSGSSHAESASATTIALTRAGVTAGHVLVAWVKHEGAPTTITLSDGASSFTGATKINHANGDLSAQWLYLLSAVASGSVTYTVTFGAARPYRSLIIFENSYTGTASFDTEATGSGTTPTNPVSGNLVTTGTDEVVYGGYGEYSVQVGSAGLVNALAATTSVYLNSPNFTAAWGRIFTSTFTGTVTLTVSEDAWICNGIAIKAAAGDVAMPFVVTAPYRPLRR